MRLIAKLVLACKHEILKKKCVKKVSPLLTIFYIDIKNCTDYFPYDMINIKNLNQIKSR